MSAYRNAGVVLERGATTLDLRTRAIEAPKWDMLLAAPPKRGQDRRIPGQRNAALRARRGDVVRAGILIKLDGAYLTNGGWAPDSAANLYSLLDEANDFLDDDGPCVVTVHRLGSLLALTGVLVVEDPGLPAWRSEAEATLIVDVTLPNGRLTPVESP